MKYLDSLLCLFIFYSLLTGCKTQENVKHEIVFDTQAHRGGRGLMPENTIPAMLNAIDKGVYTLELDLQISKDKKVIVSHDPYFNEKITTTPEKEYLTKAEAQKRLLYNMPYDSITKYDVGLKTNPDFPHKQNIAVCKPLLSDLINATEKYAKQQQQSIHYNMEIKSTATGEYTRHPPVKEYIDLVMEVVTDHHILDRTTIQSFDQRTLRTLHKKYPSIKTSYLVNYKNKRPVNELINELGFRPTIYSPDYRHVTPELVKYCHSKGIKVIPWTVNDLSTIQKMINLNVDGLISDYPNLFEKVKFNK